MRTIRKQIFETNSSSVHALILGKEISNILPNDVEFDFFDMQEYEIDDICVPYNDPTLDITNKASFIFEELISRFNFNLVKYNECRKFIVDTLAEIGIVATIPVYKRYFERIDSYNFSEIKDFFEECIIKRNSDMLLRYLFSIDTIIDGFEDECGDNWEKFEAGLDKNKININECYTDRR